jgi:hypothetical protein
MANFGALGTLRHAYRTLNKPSTSALVVTCGFRVADVTLGPVLCKRSGAVSSGGTADEAGICNPARGGRTPGNVPPC